MSSNFRLEFLNKTKSSSNFQPGHVFPKTEIFPNFLSSNVRKITYPEKNFKYILNKFAVHVFVLFMNIDHVISFSKRSMNERFMQNVIQIGKECQTFREFFPECINWTQIIRRYKIPPTNSSRINADTRLGFYFKNCFLVKAYFTFGQRTVEKDTCHILQVLNVPLLFYLNESPKLSKKDKLFPVDSILEYDRLILSPNTCFEIPAGTTYVLFTTQKCFFSLDVVRKGTKLPFDCVNPLEARVRKLERLCDLPPMTPHISEENQNIDNCNMPEAKRPRTEDDIPRELLHETHPEYFMSPEENTNASVPQTQLTFYLVPSQPTLPSVRPEETLQAPPPERHFPLPILNREIIVSSPDFVKYYEKLKNHTYFQNPPWKLLPDDFISPERDDIRPLDLSVRSMEDESSPRLQNENLSVSSIEESFSSPRRDLSQDENFSLSSARPSPESSQNNVSEEKKFYNDVDEIMYSQQKTELENEYRNNEMIYDRQITEFENEYGNNDYIYNRQSTYLENQLINICEKIENGSGHQTAELENNLNDFELIF